ncbi:B-cell receptor-associated protein 31-like-domain-containing protein [Chytriomyces sp. MP71]|nr:B-cell receptor-associated protein 31-like-domain-containing protein [Chytriomyces sp. MP71]
MSIFNQLAFVMLIGEIAAYLILLIPMNFIPVRARKAAMNFGASILANDTIVWITRILLLVVGGVFADTLMRLHRLDSELHHGEDKEGHHHHHYDSPLEEMQFKSKLFYSQRNMYLSLMSLFMTVVLYRRVRDIYQILHLQDASDSEKTLIKNLKQQVEILVNSASTDDKKKAAATSDKTALSAASTSIKEAEKKEKAPVVEQAEIPASSSFDPSNDSGMRKRK